MKKFGMFSGLLAGCAYLMAGMVFADDYLITTIAGGGASLGDGGNATFAQLNHPAGIAVDPLGNIYVSDTWNQRVRKIDSSGLITTIAGNGTKDYSGDLFTATAAQLNNPGGVTADTYGNIYIADTSNNRVRKVDASGFISTIAGSPGVFLGNGGSATSASMNLPASVAVDLSGNIYIADTSNNCIRKIDSVGIITMIAGNTSAGYAGDNGPAAEAQLNNPSGIAVDSFGNIYIADTGNNRIRKIDMSGVITTIAGNGTASFAGDGWPATTAQLNNPSVIAVDTKGNIYIADTGNNRIRKVDTSGVITTIAGNGNPGSNPADASNAISAQLRAPSGVAVDSSGNVYISDTGNNLIRKLILNEFQQ